VKKRKRKKEKAAKPREVFFGSFLDTKKELGCGAKPHCYIYEQKKQPNNLSRKNSL